METKQKETGNFFKTIYRTRVIIKRGDMPIINLSVLFSLIALLTAPWLVIFGVLIALLMGYRISVNRGGEGFESSFEEVVENSKRTVQKVFTDDEE